METLQQKALIATIITFYFVIHCNGVKVTLTIPETKDIYVSYGETLMIECKLNSTTFDPNESRSWVANGVTLINDGSYLSAGSGYNETSGTSGFSLSTPTLDYSFDGTKYQCNYGFDQAAVDVKITDIGSTTQSSGDCIDGKSIDKCWFSLSKVIPEISPPNLTISYEDDTVGDITPMLNVTSRFNADGKTRAYDFKIESTSFSKFIKAITLSFKAGPISRTLIIITDCSLDIFLYGFLPVFLIVLIVSIAIIIILKIERLPQQFGELAWKKLVIIAICFVVAIIIGVCLGLLIKGCDKKYLALGLSLLFGILIVVALIFALIYYHKKCESRRGS